MADLNETIRGLECKKTPHIDTCADCKYFYEEADSDYLDFQYHCERSQIEADALSLLKTQKEKDELQKEEMKGVDAAFDRIIAGMKGLLAKAGPRVMTLGEAQDAEVAWLERYADPEDFVEPIIKPVIIRYYENGFWQCIIEQDENTDLSLFLDDFNTGFRFWTSRPTDEQRKAVKWYE